MEEIKFLWFNFRKRGVVFDCKKMSNEIAQLAVRAYNRVKISCMSKIVTNIDVKDTNISAISCQLIFISLCKFIIFSNMI